MSDADTVIETHGLTKRYSGGVLAVDRLDLRVPRGEVFGFLGPNGAGKTTTLRMLLGLVRPTAGTARVAGDDPGAPAGLRRVGSLVENPAFYPYLSGPDNLRVIARYTATPEARIGPALEEVQLTAAGGQHFAHYSMGMKQRLAVAAALLKDPDLLILDEPTNGLDPQGVVDMRELIRGLGQGERTVLLSSHLLNEVEQTCQRAGVISHGRLIAQGSLDELRGGATLLVRAAPRDRARQLLVHELGEAAVRDEDGGLRLRVDPGRAPELNRRLVEAGVDVSELRPSERSLEDVFLQLTGVQNDAGITEAAS
jgi:ABC-type multidrug transport system ATPase subunit